MITRQTHPPRMVPTEPQALTRAPAPGDVIFGGHWSAHRALSEEKPVGSMLATERERPENLYMLKWGADHFHFLPRCTQSGVGRTPGASPVGNPHICRAGVGTELPGAPQRLLSPENFLTSFQCAHPQHLDLGRRLTSRLLAEHLLPEGKAFPLSTSHI